MEIPIVDEDIDDILHENEVPKTQTTNSPEDIEKFIKNDDILRKNTITNKQKSETEVTYCLNI